MHFKIISMSKKTHQIFFAAIIINLILILVLVNLSQIKFIMFTLSLFAMLILPLGIKGGVYHRMISSAGLIFYIFALIITN